MTKIQLNLPDELARAAEQAGLLAPEALQRLLQDKLRADAALALQQGWAKQGSGDISPEDERLIAEAIKKVRAARKAA